METAELENCTAELRKIKMLLHEDVVYQILQWLLVISLLRFKLVRKTWHALIKSNDFIKHHLYHHRYDPSLKDKNHDLIHIVECKDSPFTFPLISIDNFGPNACVQLDCSDQRECFPLIIEDIVSYNGIVCLNLYNRKGKHSICLWNPATKQSRILPQSPALETKHNSLLTTVVGFGFDVENNDYKVVNLCRNDHVNEERVEVYSLNTDSWRSVTTIFPFRDCVGKPRIPFNNGTCFFWYVYNFTSEMAILCFDFSFERIRSISFPNANNFEIEPNAIVLSDKIACVLSTNDNKTEIWVFDGYGSVNESWFKLYTIDLFSALERGMSVMWHSMKGNYLFFKATSHMYRSNDVVTKMVYGYNVVTKEIKNLYSVEICKKTYVKDLHLRCLKIKCYTITCYGHEDMVEFKESLLSVWKGNNE